MFFCFYSGNLSSLSLGVVVTNNSLLEVTVIDHVDTLKDTVSYEVGMGWDSVNLHTDFLFANLYFSTNYLQDVSYCMEKVYLPESSLTYFCISSPSVYSIVSSVFTAGVRQYIDLFHSCHPDSALSEPTRDACRISQFFTSANYVP